MHLNRVQVLSVSNSLIAIFVGVPAILIAIYSFDVYSSSPSITGSVNLTKATNTSQVNTLNSSVNQTTLKQSQVSQSIVNETVNSLDYAVFTIEPNDQAKEIIGNYFAQEKNHSNNYIAQSIRVLPKTTWWFDEFPSEKKMILVQSLDNITLAIQLARQHNYTDLIVYDIEHWSQTPSEEKERPVFSMMQPADMIHEEGLKYGLAPDADYLHSHYKSITWSKIDFVDMQLQRYSDDPERFANYTKIIGSFIKSQNPEIELFVQISLGRSDSDEASRLISSVGDMVDGIFIAYIPESSLAAEKYPSEDHAEEALDEVLNEIETFSGKI